MAQQAHLYAYHLARCPSYSASHGAVPPALVDHDSLPQLRKLFAREIKRNLFEAYLRPKKTTIKLVSNSISSSSVPGGEGMQFSPSPRGHHLLAYNSSRIYVLDVRGPDLDVKRELKILRRPVSTCILDDGSVLAVLSSDMQVDLYDLRARPPRRTQSLILDHAPRTIALSPCGSVLAAAYEGGIEVQSLNPGALPTERRAVKCDGVDSLAFSFDGTQLLGTTTVAQPPNTVILTAPYYDPGSSMGEHDISALWTTSILFPNTSRDCSHAVLLQESSSEEASWTFTYDRSFETFRAVRIDDLRNGTTYFTGPVPNASSQAPLLPCTLPAATYCGDLVSAGFEGRDVWVYGIPEDLEAVPDNAASSENAPPPDRRNSTLSGRSPSRVRETNGGRVPQWQLLCDKYRNSFVSGYKATALDGVSTVKWVAGHGSTSLQERLVVAARGVLPPKPITEEDDFDFVDGGKITILDFDYGLENGDEKEITIEVGTKEPEALEEEHRDIDTEVAIVRRRTVAQRRGGGRTGLMRSATTAPTEADTLPLPPIPAVDEDDEEDPLTPRRMLGPRTPVVASPGLRGEPEDATLEEAQEALDAPYAHASPRSGPTLRRAATAAAVNRRLHPSSATNGRIEYRRADGRAEHPHESDADNWVPPPPPYSREDPGDTPAFLRAPAIPGVGLDIIRDEQGNSLAMAPAAAQAQTRLSPPPPLASPQLSPPLVPSASPGAASRPNLPRLQTSSVHGSQGSCHRVVSSPTYQSSVLDATSERRPVSSPVGTGEFSPRSPDDEVTYDVSPVESPPPQDMVLANRQRQIPCYGLPHASPSAPMLGMSSSTNTMVPASSTSRTTDLLNSYVLNLDIPSPSLALNMDRDQHESSPVVGKLLNSQTWPRAPVPSEQTPTAEPSGYPHSAPPINNTNTDRFETALPPLPRHDQLANLPNRHGQSVPHPTTGSFQIPRVPVPYSSHRRSNSGSLVQTYHQSPSASEPDQPLIISTPTGISGAFDDPGRQLSSRGTTASAPVLMSPVPRHPLSTAGALRSSSDGLGTLIGPNGQVFSVPPPPLSSQLTASSLRHHTSLSRRQSRAKRSAAKNVKDAHQRGWAGRRIRRQTEGGADGAASSAARTDVASTSGATADKEPKSTRGGKCAVM